MPLYPCLSLLTRQCIRADPVPISGPRSLSQVLGPWPPLFLVHHLSLRLHQRDLSRQRSTHCLPAGPPLTQQTWQKARVSEPGLYSSPKPGPFLLALSPVLLNTQNLCQQSRTAWRPWPRVAWSIWDIYFSFFFPFVLGVGH